MYVMVLLGSEGVDSFGLPWGATLSDDVDALPSVLAGYAYLLWLFSVCCFLVSSNVMNLEIAHPHQKKSPKKELLETQSSSDVRSGDQLNKT